MVELASCEPIEAIDDDAAKTDGLSLDAMAAILPTLSRRILADRLENFCYRCVSETMQNKWRH